MENTTILTCLILLFSSPAMSTDDQYKDVTESWQMMQQEARSRYFETKKENGKVYQDVRNSWEVSKVQLQKRWGEMITSTQKIWVSYSDNLEVRSEVDFEKGYVRLSLVIPANSAGIDTRHEKMMKDHLRRLLSSNRHVNRNVLEDQILDKIGRTVRSETVDKFYDKEIRPCLTYSSPISDRRSKIANASIRLVPDHIDIRARKYRDTVKEMAYKYSIEPELIMAIIHTESFFNPLTVSDTGACGLMQLMPNQGGREAYAFIYKSDKPVPTEALFNPETNIELGTAYLHLIQKNHFSSVIDPQKNRYLTICAYNLGSSAVNKYILKSVDLDSFSSEELYSLLCTRTPGETREYLKNITSRINLYKPYF